MEHQHVVTFYVTDGDLVRDLQQAAGDALANGESWLMIATERHRRLLEVALVRRGLDVDAARRRGRYVGLDAAATLQQFMVDGRPDHSRFTDTVARQVAAMCHEGRSRVNAFGEMVALLWGEDNVIGAMELEDLWNEVIQDLDLALYCAYPAALVGDEQHLADTDRVCGLHTRTITPASVAGERRDGGEVDRVRVFFPVPHAVREVRTFVRSILGSSVAPAVVEDTCLVATELATNALRHVGSPFTVGVTQSDGGVHVFVRDLSSARPAARPVSHRSVSGRGLPIVAQVSTTWGTDELPYGKVVWANLPA